MLQVNPVKGLPVAGSEAGRYDLPMTHSLSETLAPITLPDSEGQDVRLGSLWEDQPAIVVFLRHYG